MDIKKYQDYVKDISPKHNKLLNMFISFTTGGSLALISTIINEYTHSLIITTLMLIIITSLLTCIGIADELFKVLQCGLIIPITGFAHSISSSIIDNKKEGFIAMGSNTFKLAGSVILYGVISSIILVLIKVYIIG